MRSYVSNKRPVTGGTHVLKVTATYDGVWYKVTDIYYNANYVTAKLWTDKMLFTTRVTFKKS